MPRASLLHQLLPAMAFSTSIAALVRPAAAADPPSDLPPVQTAPAKPAPPGLPGPAPGAAPAPSTPPGTSLPPGYGYPPPMWPSSRAEVPPGYGPTPGRYPYPPSYPMAPTPAGDPYGLPPLPPRRRHDMGLFVGGVLAVSGGMTLALIGSYLVSTAANRIEIYCDMPSTPCAHKTDEPRMVGGGLLMAVGAAVGVAGIPMWFIGSQFEAAPPEGKDKDKKPALLPEVRVGVGSASLSFRF